MLLPGVQAVLPACTRKRSKECVEIQVIFAAQFTPLRAVADNPLPALPAGEKSGFFMVSSKVINGQKNIKICLKRMFSIK